MAQTTTTNEPSPLEGSAEKLTQNRLTQLNGIRWRYDVHGRTVEKDNGQTRWHYRYDGEHRLTEVISQPRDRNRPQTEVSFRYDPLGRLISNTHRQMPDGLPTGKLVATRFVRERLRLLQEMCGDVLLTYVYSDQDSYDPLARIDGVDAPEIFWFHCQPNGTPERMTDSEGQVRWEGVNNAGANCCGKARRRYLGIPRICGCRGNTWIVRQGCTTICSGITTRTADGLRSRTR
ncbi:Rhs family protein [Enterobacter hormaechei]|nr:Rhs family protein [Enterobacter hormaechei]SAB88747.1 Rhs family protein [Enterobacter hormaechei]VAC08701.1 Rhs family protein [Enterobacter hormaechei]VAL95380.1 Rhs family protein [Enterobacter hormaechei]